MASWRPTGGREGLGAVGGRSAHFPDLPRGSRPLAGYWPVVGGGSWGRGRLGSGIAAGTLELNTTQRLRQWSRTGVGRLPSAVGRVQRGSAASPLRGFRSAGSRYRPGMQTGPQRPGPAAAPGVIQTTADSGNTRSCSPCGGLACFESETFSSTKLPSPPFSTSLPTIS